MTTLGVAGWFSAARSCGAETNYLDGVRDFDELVQRIEKRCPACVRRDKDGAVVDISAIGVTDDALAIISREPSVRELTFTRMNVTDKGIAALRQMTNLVSLRVAARNVVQVASNLSQLRRLDFWCSGFTPAELPGLIQMTNLEELRLGRGWTLGTNALAAMTNLMHLKKLNFHAGMYNEELAKWLGLKGPDLAVWRNGKLNPFLNQVASLTNLASLEELDLEIQDFGDEQLKQLAGAPSLKRLTLALWNDRLSKDWRRVLEEFPVLENAEVWQGGTKQTWVREP